MITPRHTTISKNKALILTTKDKIPHNNFSKSHDIICFSVQTWFQNRRAKCKRKIDTVDHLEKNTSSQPASVQAQDQNSVATAEPATSEIWGEAQPAGCKTCYFWDLWRCLSLKLWAKDYIILQCSRTQVVGRLTLEVKVWRNWKTYLSFRDAMPVYNCILCT